MWTCNFPPSPSLSPPSSSPPSPSFSPSSSLSPSLSRSSPHSSPSFLYITLLFLLLFSSTQTWGVQSAEDPYKLLGVTKSSTPEEIKYAYRQLALKWYYDRILNLTYTLNKVFIRHPDNTPQAQEKFVELTNAYEVSYFFSYL